MSKTIKEAAREIRDEFERASEDPDEFRQEAHKAVDALLGLIGTIDDMNVARHLTQVIGPIEAERLLQACLEIGRSQSIDARIEAAKERHGR